MSAQNTTTLKWNYTNKVVGKWNQKENLFSCIRAIFNKANSLNKSYLLWQQEYKMRVHLVHLLTYLCIHSIKPNEIFRYFMMADHPTVKVKMSDRQKIRNHRWKKNIRSTVKFLWTSDRVGKITILDMRIVLKCVKILCIHLCTHVCTNAYICFANRMSKRWLLETLLSVKDKRLILNSSTLTTFSLRCYWHGRMWKHQKRPEIKRGKRFSKQRKRKRLTLGVLLPAITMSSAVVFNVFKYKESEEGIKPTVRDTFNVTSPVTSN